MRIRHTRQRLRPAGSAVAFVLCGCGGGGQDSAWYVNVVTANNRNGELRGPFPLAPAPP